MFIKPLSMAIIQNHWLPVERLLYHPDSSSTKCRSGFRMYLERDAWTWGLPKLPLPCGQYRPPPSPQGRHLNPESSSGKSPLTSAPPITVRWETVRNSPLGESPFGEGPGVSLPLRPAWPHNYLPANQPKHQPTNQPFMKPKTNQKTTCQVK